MTISPRAALLGFAGLFAVAWLAAGAPLLVYTVSLAAFGAVHVLVELRYVDERFGARMATGLAAAFGLLLGLIVLLRVLALADVVAWPARGVLEVGLVAALAIVVVPRLRGGARVLALVAAALLLAGASCAPLFTLVLLAVLHNVTPVGFLAERLRGRERRTAMTLCAVAFVVVPAWIASGAPRALLAGAGLAAPDLAILSAGPLRDHLRVFVLPGLEGGPRAIDLFAAVAYLQVLHYAVVIGILPRLGAGAEDARRARLPWPPRAVFAVLLAGAAVLSLVAFAATFRDARAVYGVLAAVHAWVEVPVLLLALAPAAGG